MQEDNGPDLCRKRANVLKSIRRAEETDGTLDTIQHRILLEDRARRKAHADKQNGDGRTSSRH